jgi:hypothetical protein
MQELDYDAGHGDLDIPRVSSKVCCLPFLGAMIHSLGVEPTNNLPRCAPVARATVDLNLDQGSR